MKNKRACEITDRIFGDLIKNWKKEGFRNEKDVKRYLLRQMRKYKVKMAFQLIVSCSKTFHRIHQKPRHKLRKGFLILDFGVKYNGYCSDMTRTLYLGTPTEKEKQLYEKVRMCQERCIAMIRPGVKYKDIDIFARKYLGKDKKYFVHALGHGIGKKVHEMPKVSQKSEDKAKAGDIVAIEPGIYKKRKINIRVEDMVFVRKTKAIALTKSTKKLMVMR